MRRVRRALLVVVFVGGIVTSFIPAGAQEEPPFGGYQATALGRAISVLPTFPAFSVVETPLEGTVSLAEVNLTTGGAALARSSTVWPGPLFVGLGPLIGQAGAPPQFVQALPDYPLVAEAREFDGEVKTDAGPMSMRSTGKPDNSSAESSVGGLAVGNVLEIRSLRSGSTGEVGDKAVEALSSVTLEGISLLDGAITIDGVRSLVSADSNAVKAGSKGGTDVVGLEIAGIKARVGPDGVQAAEGESIPGVDPNEQLAAALKGLGARMSLAAVTSTADGGEASRMSPGLLIQVPTPEAGPLPPGTLSIILGGASVTVAASEPTGGASDDGGDDVAADDEVAAGVDGGVVLASGAIGTFAETAAPSGGPDSVAALPPAAASSGSPSARALVDARPAAFAYRFGGVPVSLVASLLAGVALSGHFVRRFAETVIARRG